MKLGVALLIVDIGGEPGDPISSNGEDGLPGGRGARSCDRGNRERPGWKGRAS
jgi:hypothetical protein